MGTYSKEDNSKTLGYDALPTSRKVAIVGIGCRYANGINGVPDFVRMLRDGLDCTGEPPADRYDMPHYYRPRKAAGKMYNQRGGYIRDNLLAFDRQFFKMPPDEANALDPQVRLLLEVSWEGIENAGIPASRLRGSNTGVYMGVTASEYSMLTTSPLENISQYTNSGCNSCMVANRISYEFDLHGPSFSVDTACSSSLYAIQLACEAICSGSCQMALAGGVNLLLTPVAHIGFCQARMLSPDGHCKSFDSSADGYSRSEGAGVVVLKPLEKALEDGDNIYAIIRGGALSNDGHTPGISNPSYDAQVDLVYRACRQAKIDPHKVEYIEAHGTGTKVGDKTEANAIGETLGKWRSSCDPSLYIGSVKSNFGHTEGAAGVAGIIKVALMQKYNFIAPVVHFKKGNENVAFEELNLKVPTQPLEWPRPQKQKHRLAGCSSFGFGGANAQLILEEPPDTYSQGTPSDSNKPTVTFISAASKSSLVARKIQFANLFEHLTEEGGSFSSIAATSFYRSQHHHHRCALVACSPAEAVAKLQTNHDNNQGLVEGTASAPGNLSKVAFIFTGMGSQWWAMGQKLLQEDKTFNGSIKQFDEVLKTLGATWSIHNLLTVPPDRDTINKTEHAQPAICALEMALVQVLTKFGVTPDVIVGHSLGEVAAAYASGMLSFEDAVKVIYYRGQELHKTSGHGKMLVALHPVEDIIKSLQQSQLRGAIDVAALNSPTQIVLSGDSDAIDKFGHELKADGIKTVVLKVNNAFHSFQQEQIKDSLLDKFSFLDVCKSDTTTEKHIPMLSTVTVKYICKNQLNDKHYWWSNVRQKVSFLPAIQKLLCEGYSTFVEVGAHPALTPAILDIIRGEKEPPSKPLVISTLQRPKDISSPADDVTILLQNLCRLHCEGYPVDFSCIYPDKYEIQQLPLYPWQRVQCSSITESAKEAMLFPRTSHNLLGKREDISPGKSKLKHIWTSQWTVETVPWILDHVIQDSIIAPGTSYLETAIQAASELQNHEMPFVVTGVELQRFLFMPECKATVQVVVEEQGKDRKFSIYSKGGKQTWSRHATGFIMPPNLSPMRPKIDVQDIINKCSGAEAKSASFLYETFNSMGYALGPSFLGMSKAWFNEDFSVAYNTVKATEDIKKELSLYNVHPAMMDSLMQGFGTAVVLKQQKMAEGLKVTYKPVLHVPLRVKKVQVLGSMEDEVYICTKVTEKDGEMLANIDVAVSTGEVVFQMEGLVFGKATDVDEDNEMCLWMFDWEHIKVPEVDETNLRHHHNTTEMLVISNTANITSVVDQITCGMKADIFVMQKDESEVSSVLAKYPQLQHLLFFASHEFSDVSTYSAKEFTDLVDQTCVSLTSVVQQLIGSFRKELPRLWIVTNGANAIQKNDQVDPMGYALQSLGISFIHEALNLSTVMVDLPAEESAWQKSLSMLRTMLQSSLTTENELAVREDESGKLCLFGRRMINRPPRFITQVVPSNKWAIKHDTKNRGPMLIPALPDRKDEHLDVNVKAFRMLESKGTNSFNAIIAGKVTKNYGKFQVGDSIAGFVAGPVSANTIMDPEYSAKFVSISPAQAVDTLHRYLVPFVICRACSLNKARVAVIGNDTTGKQAFRKLLESFSCVVHEALTHDDPDPYDALILLPGGDTGLATEFIKRLKMFGRCILVTNGDKEDNEKVEQLMTKYVFIQLIQIPESFGKTHNFVQGLNSHISSLFSKVEGDVSFLLEQVPSILLADVLDIEISDIITVDDRPVQVHLANLDNMFQASSEAAYIVTGASKGFGIEVIKWLYRSGARNVVAFSRSTPIGEDMEKVISLQEKGLSLEWKKVDVTNITSVQEAMKDAKDNGYHIEGIFHCAAVYRDIWLSRLQQKDWHDVMLPKAYGGYALHQVALDLKLPLKHFVMFSSMVVLIGNAGQTNYCAANSFLYSLGEMRRSKGLPATVVSFGTINSTGFAARNNLIKTWEDKGVLSISPNTALNMVGTMMSLDILHLGVSGQFLPKSYFLQSRPQVTEHLSQPEGAISRWKGIFMHELLEDSKHGREQDILDETPGKAKDIIHHVLASFLADRLGISDPESITLENPPTSYGLDSLMSSDMSNHISEMLQVAVLPVELLNDKNTIGKLVGSIYDKILAKGQDAGDVNTEDGPKFVYEESIADPSAVLICFPPNGGGLSSYGGWHMQLAKKQIQVYVAQMPGWEGSNGGKPMSSFSEIVESLTQEILPLIRGHIFSLYGHSFGALLAFEVAHRLKANHGLSPDDLFLGAWYSPVDPYPCIWPDEAMTKMFDPNTPIEEAMQVAQCFTFLEGDVLNNVVLMRRILPCIEVCLDMLKEYKYTWESHLPSNLTIYAGNSDRFLPPQYIQRWDKVLHTDHQFKFNVVSGTHLFQLDSKCQEQIIKDIVQSLSGN